MTAIELDRVEERTEEKKAYLVSAYPFDDCRVHARSKSAAIYAAFKQLCEAGYFQGRRGFHYFLTVNHPQAREAAP